MPSRAILRCQISNPTINEDRTAVLGCQLVKINKRGVYMGLDGKQHEIVATKGLVDSLLGICKESERVSGHFTHDWILKGEEGIKTTVATWRNFRLDGQGNLIADAFLWPSDQKEAILHAAENDPRGMAVSMVFDWEGEATNPKAVAVDAADFVERGAITEALCRAVCSAKTQTKAICMDINELLAALADPQVKEALKAIIKSHEDTSEVEAEVGVTAEDSKPEDEKQPAIMRAVLRVSRAMNRKLAAIKPEAASIDDAAQEAICKKVEAALVKKGIGTKRFIGQGGEAPEGSVQDKFNKAVAAAVASGLASNPARAKWVVAKANPELYAEYQQAISE